MEILAYWVERNGSTLYSEKLDGMFRSALRLIASQPKIGRPTSDPDVRVKTVGDHLIFYSATSNAVHVLTLWHVRRNPADRPF
ncbi:MAG: type II toxin-antitoxin system RelE/ParE family toxin [Flavobacteriales bacterium]|nr:MAG: type II toxin-antitoxin system RelE/ParE family toxin [Flavobacteriales bacterium]